MKQGEEMTQYKIAVVTENLELASFFELEFSYRGFEVDALFSVSDINGEYIMAIIDADTCSPAQSSHGRSVMVSSFTDTVITSEICSLVWPTPLTDIDKLCRTVMLGDEHPASYSKSEDLSILTDLQNLTVILNGQTIKLTKSEFAILIELCEAAGNTVKRERIMELLGAERGNISDVYIYHLRKKLEGNSGKRLIFTERGVGYRTLLKSK